MMDGCYVANNNITHDVFVYRAFISPLNRDYILTNACPQQHNGRRADRVAVIGQFIGLLQIPYRYRPDYEIVQNKYHYTPALLLSTFLQLAGSEMQLFRNNPADADKQFLLLQDHDLLYQSIFE
jgi:hypothetical protein